MCSLQLDILPLAFFASYNQQHSHKNTLTFQVNYCNGCAV